MAERNLRLRWAHKLLRSKSFVVVTDKESIIAIRGMDPAQLHDVLVLQEQAASLDNFLYRIKDLREEHTRQIEALTQKSHREKPKATRRKTPKKEAKPR